MKLSECTPGTMVTTGDRLVGVVVGITNNVTHEDINKRQKINHAIPLVQWSSGETYGIHHSILSIFTG